jgi:hypothetical protein
MEIAARGGDRGVPERLLHKVDGCAPVEAVAGVGIADGRCTLRAVQQSALVLLLQHTPELTFPAALTSQPFSSTCLTAKVLSVIHHRPLALSSARGFLILCLCAFAAALWRTRYS